MVLEAMKMEQPVLAPVAGQIEDIPVQTGEAVSAGQVLCRLTLMRQGRHDAYS